MLIYEKKVDGVRHLFGTTGNVPSDSDVQLTYKDYDGDVITPTLDDSYVDDKAHGVIRVSDGAFVSAWIGDTNVIPGGDYEIPVATVESISATTTKKFKTAYTAGEKLDLTGLTVNAVYSNGKTERVNDFVATPAAGEALTTATTQISIAYKSKTTTVAITVTATEAE